MAKTKAAVKKVSDKLKLVSESFSVNMYDNGYMFEISGRDEDNDWKTAKIMVSSVEDLIELIREVSEMERDS